MVPDSLVKNRGLYNTERGGFLHPLRCANLTRPPPPVSIGLLKFLQKGAGGTQRVETQRKRASDSCSGTSCWQNSAARAIPVRGQGESAGMRRDPREAEGRAEQQVGDRLDSFQLPSKHRESLLQLEPAAPSIHPQASSQKNAFAGYPTQTTPPSHWGVRSPSGFPP